MILPKCTIMQTTHSIHFLWREHVRVASLAHRTWNNFQTESNMNQYSATALLIHCLLSVGCSGGIRVSLATVCHTVHVCMRRCTISVFSLDANRSVCAVPQVKDGVENSWVETEVWRMELYLSFGILALGVLSLLAVTSLPSVGNSLNWREFSFVQVSTPHISATRGSSALCRLVLPTSQPLEGVQLCAG